MPRLIYADEFRKRIDHYPPDIRDIAKKELRYTPTVDAVEVIRCRDCKWYDITHPYGTVNPDAHHCKANDRFYSAEHFCGYGKRRDNAEKTDKQN